MNRENSLDFAIIRPVCTHRPKCRPYRAAKREMQDVGYPNGPNFVCALTCQSDLGRQRCDEFEPPCASTLHVLTVFRFSFKGTSEVLSTLMMAFPLSFV
jgi:hypothetical protein